MTNMSHNLDRENKIYYIQYESTSFVKEAGIWFEDIKTARRPVCCHTGMAIYYPTKYVKNVRDKHA